MSKNAEAKDESATKQLTVSSNVETVVSRIDGYYICEVDYDMHRGIFWYQGETDTFHSGNAILTKKDFTYISKNPIDLYDDNLWDMEFC